MSGSQSRQSLAALALLAFVLLLCAGCGRTSLKAGEDAAASDAAISGPDATAPPDAGVTTVLCRSDDPCRSGTVCMLDRDFTPVDLAAVRLICSTPEGPGVGNECVRETDCGRGLCAVAGTCLRPCETDTHCPDGDRCLEVYARTSFGTLQPVDACVPEVAPAVGVDVQRRRVEDISGRTEIELGPASPTTQYTIVAGRQLNVLRVSAQEPDDVIFNPSRLGPGQPPPDNPVSPRGDVLTVMLPNGGYPVEAATSFTLRVEPDRSTDAELYRFERADPGTVLNIDLYYVDGGGFTPAGPRGPARVAEALDTLAGYLERGGVRLGEVRQHELVGGLLRRYSVITTDLRGEYADLGPMFELTRGARWPSVAIFLVRDLDSALGISGGIPGPFLPGTPSSGVAIAVDLHDIVGLPVDTDLARTISHEVGHHLGLFHTTELDGSVFEPIDDTMICTPDLDDGDGLYTPEECFGGGGAENMMFWAASGDGFSDGQADLVRRALILD